MPDVEKVIKGLKEAFEVIVAHVPERYWGYSLNACKDALALLKAQEPVEPIRDINGVYYCGMCDTICVGYEVEFTHSIIKVENYCHKCGRKVKWE